MNIDEALKVMHNPKNFHEQMESSASFIIHTSHDAFVGPAYYNALGSIPERVKAAALDCFIRGDSASYHARVLRASLRHFEKHSYIDDTIPVLSNEELP